MTRHLKAGILQPEEADAARHRLGNNVPAAINMCISYSSQEFLFILQLFHDAVSIKTIWLRVLG